MRAATIILLLTVPATPVAAQMADNVQTPLVEVSAAKPFYRTALDGSHWTTLGGDVSLTRNIGERAGSMFMCCGRSLRRGCALVRG